MWDVRRDSRNMIEQIEIDLGLKQTDDTRFPDPFHNYKLLYIGGADIQGISTLLVY